MPAPLAKGAIIAASLIVAVSIAVYQNPQVQRWLDLRRRKLALALHHLGDEITPPSRPARNAHAAEEQRRWREETIRRNRNELVRKAREEGVAVDLDELARICDDVHAVQPRTRSRGSSFDDLVNEDGMLRSDEKATATGTDEKATATGTDDAASQGLRHRGSAARGFMSGAAYANPFADSEEAQLLFDRDLIGAEENSVDGGDEEDAPVPHDFTATMEDDLEGLLVDLSDPFSAPFQQAQASSATEQNETDTSFHSSASHMVASAMADSPSTQGSPSSHEEGEFDELVGSTGTLTPTEENFSTDASLIGHGADDVAVISSLQNGSVTADDARSQHDPFGSEASFHDDRFSEASFSDIGSRTPSGSDAWTDVGSDAGSETGSQAGH